MTGLYGYRTEHPRPEPRKRLTGGLIFIVIVGKYHNNKQLYIYILGVKYIYISFN